MMTWSSVLYTTARWSAAPPVATRFSSSPTPSNITFLDRIMMMVIRWWWSGSSGFPPPPHRPASPSWSGWWWSGDGDGGGHHLPGHYQQYRAQRKVYFNFWDENSLLLILCFETRTRISFFQPHALGRKWDENKNRDSDNCDNGDGDAVGYCDHDDSKIVHPDNLRCFAI